MTTKFYVTCSDGRMISATTYSAIEPINNQVIVINSALGVRQSFYKALALYLSDKGYTVITWDPRGIGDSSMANVKADPARLRDWGALDLDALLNYVVDKKTVNWKDVILVGHSAGGHLVGLCPSINNVRHIILVCSGTCNWRLYPVRAWPKLCFGWYVLFPVLIRIFGYIPRQFGIGHHLTHGIASDWRNWSIRDNYLFSDETLTDMYYHNYHGEIHSIGFSDDVGFSPKKTIYDLMNRFPMATKNVQILEPKALNQKRIGHFSFFKKHQKQAWDRVLMNILRNI